MNIDTATLESIQEFSFYGYNCICKVLDVIDGDTLVVAMPYNNFVYKVRVRLKDVYAPETRTRDDEEKRRGIACRERLVRLLLSSLSLPYDSINCNTMTRDGIKRIFKENTVLCKLECDENDCFGRTLGTIKINENDININEMINDYLCSE